MRTALVGLALLGLLALVAAGSSGEEWGGGLEERNVPGAFADYAFTFAVLYLVLAGVIAVWALTGPRGGGPKKERPRRRDLAGFAIILLASAAYLAYADPNPPTPNPEQAVEPGAPTQVTPELEETSEREPSGPEFQWWVAIVLALTIAAAVVYLRLQRDEPPGLDAAEELDAVLTETLDELELDPDPRRAVIQAYVRMETVLGAHGHARLPHEAPLEYLARVLRELEVRPAAAHALTELFERARFSRHRIDTAMRAEAVASLAAVRDDLRAAA
jgi:hypothetical protein